MPAILIIPASIVLILAGIVVTPLPIPFGVPMIIVGVVALIGHSNLAARLFAGLRGRWTRFDLVVRFLESRAPAVMARALMRTRPRI